MNTSVLVIGEGVLADCVCTVFDMTSDYSVVRQSVLKEEEIPSTTLTSVIVHDGWQPDVLARAEDVFRRLGIAWVSGFTTFGEGVIGPMVRKEVPGCSQCANYRRLMTDVERKQMWQLHLKLSVHGGILRDGWASNTGLWHMAHYLVDGIVRDLSGVESWPNGRLTLMNLKTLETTRHYVLPNPHCSVCGHLPDDAAELATITLESTPKVHENSFRTKNMGDLRKVLEGDYVDYRTGLLDKKVHDLTTPFAAVSLNLPLMMGDEGTAGRAHVYTECQSIAILEGLERYCGLVPRGKQTVIFDTYANLQDCALNPCAVGLHDAAQYARADSPFQTFNEVVPLDWVWGFSLIKNRPVLLPELLAYYSLGCRPGFVYETSNGCALGGSLTEAIFHGILEVVERDGFLMTWYGQLRLPSVNLDTIPDEEVQLMVTRMRCVAGYRVHLFNATMENGIPCVFAIAKNMRTHGVNLVCAAGCHIDPIRAVKGALHELAGMLLRFDDVLVTDRETILKMFHDPSQVKHMEHHSLLYALPEAEGRLGFLLEGERPLQTFHDAFSWRNRNVDLRDDVEDLLDIFRNLHLDVIVINQTAPEIERNGLHCVKVLIPGMLPMTFGHHLTRLTGLDRVFRVPMELGYYPNPLTRNDLNPHPHPFC